MKKSFIYFVCFLFVIAFVAILIFRQYFIPRDSQSPQVSQVSEVSDLTSDKEFFVEVTSPENEPEALEEQEEQAVTNDLDSLEIKDDETTTGEESEMIAPELFPPTSIVPPMLIQPKRPQKGGVLRIGFVTDTQIQSSMQNGTRRLEKTFTDRLSYFLQQMAENFGPDFVITNGDVIEGTGIPSNQGKEEIRLTKELFQKFSIPAYWVLGNHDVRSVTKEQWKDVLDGYTHKAFLVKGYKIIILDSNFGVDGTDVVSGKNYTRGNVGPSEIKWLKKELESPEQKIVFMHHPPLRGVGTTIAQKLLKNAMEVQQLFSEGNVMAVVSGHIEDLYSQKINGVHYFVFPGLTKSPAYQGNYVELEIKKNKITAEMSFLDPKYPGKYKTIEIKETETGE